MRGTRNARIRSLTERPFKRREYRIELPQHIGIPEPENPESLRPQPRIPCGIAPAFRVLASIHLNDQPRLE
jgi:hypothetical protein